MHEKLIRAAVDAGFTQTSVRDYFDTVRRGEAATSKVIVHRHDIDTDLRTTRKLFEIEKKYGIRASYYFRLSTLDFGLMREIEEYGSEAIYHYEELASFAKRNKIKDPALVRNRLPEIREAFPARPELTPPACASSAWARKSSSIRMRTSRASC
ncbi:hypothetical protein [Massilia sp. WF1]|uniref:hypothetical protein n=1 Tax=Massilia sp. WF1 TaxID=1406431 RepID=UPI00068BB017|nr:hypothetical protein [Massilia sp. WF1]